MSERAIFGLIREGQSSFHAERWALVFLHRELIFGPDDFEAWVTQLEEVEEFSHDFFGGAVADYDRKRLLWHSEIEAMRIPRVAAIYHRLLQAAWPGFQVAFAAEGVLDLAQAVGAGDPGAEYGQERPATVRDAARLPEVEEEEEVEDDEAARFEDGEIRAWVTFVGAEGAVRHRHLDCLSADLLGAEDGALAALRQLPPAEVPPEEVVSEGLWIDEANRAVGVWGSAMLHSKLPAIRQWWHGWEVQWADRGYQQQCEVAGTAGMALSDGEALARILPVILSTQRFDMATVASALGSGLKQMAAKATGCLLAVICMPLVIFGLVSGNWRAALISIAITCGVVIVAFKIIEHRFRRSFRNTLSGAGEHRSAPAAAGPLEPAVRRQRIDRLLVLAGLPQLAEVEPLFPQKGEADLLIP